MKYFEQDESAPSSSGDEQPEVASSRLGGGSRAAAALRAPRRQPPRGAPAGEGLGMIGGEEAAEGGEGGGGGGDGAGDSSGGEGFRGLAEGEMADIPFEELQALRSDGSGPPQWGGAAARRGERAAAAAKKRENKNMPMALSSKKPVPRLRDVVQAPKKVFRDPRFEALCGDFEEDRFKKSYRFLYDEELPAERQKLKKALKREKNGGRQEELQARLLKIDQQLKEEEQRRAREERRLQQTKEVKEAVQSGKRPFFKKSSDVRKEDLVRKFKELKDSGKLEAFLAKRRKRTATREHKKVPFRRDT